MSFSHSPSISREGLVLYLDAGSPKSYGGSGTTWTDISRNGNNGTLVNGVSASGGAMVFDGVNDYVDCGTISQQILSNNQFTANFWLRPIGFSRIDFFCIKNFNASSDDIGFLIDSDNKIKAYFKVQGVVTGNIGGFASASNAIISRNTNYNISIMKDSTQKIVMYINGILDNNTYSTVTDISTVAPTKLWIGSNKTSDTALTLPFNGNIAQVSIYNRALSQAEILQNYNATKGRYGL